MTYKIIRIDGKDDELTAESFDKYSDAYALLEELQAEFKTVSHAMSKIDELPEFVENVIWLEIQRLLEKNADLTDRITRAENLLKWVRKQDGMDRSKYVTLNGGKLCRVRGKILNLIQRKISSYFSGLESYNC